MAGLWRRWTARYRGWIDGRQLIPGETDVSPPPRAQALARTAERHMVRRAGRWHGRDRTLNTRCAGRALELLQAIADKSAAERDEERARLRMDDQRARAEQLHRELNPPGDWYCSAGVYRATVLLLGIGDLPLTFLAFQTLGLSPVYTVALSAMVVAMLTALGHFAGHYARYLRLGRGMLLSMILLLALGFIASLTYLRETAVQTVMGDGAVNGAAGVMVFAFVTAIGFAVPALLAFHVRMEPEAGAVRAAETAVWRAFRANRRADRRCLRARRRLYRAVADRRSAHDQAAWALESLRQETAVLLAEYAAANLAMREGAGTPPGLTPEAQHQLLPTLQLPPLAWDSVVQQFLLEGATADAHT